MRKFTFYSILFLTLGFTFTLRAQNGAEFKMEESLGKNNIAYKWRQMAFLATANYTEKFKPRPTVTSRFLALTFVAIFDAWSKYNSKVFPVYLQNVGRVSEIERTLKNKEIAVSYAAYGTLCKYYVLDKELFSAYMKKLGYDTNNKSMDLNNPKGIGNLAARAVIDARKGDGSNENGEEVGINATPYCNYINYEPINSPNKNFDINHWQPKYFSPGNGGRYAPVCLTSFWGKVKPIALKTSNQFQPIPPPLVGSDQLKKEVEEVISLQAILTNKQKALVEFMRVGPKSVQQAGHWLKLSQQVSKRDSYAIDQYVKMFFFVQSTAMDCCIACWETKLFYDYARPYALVHEYFKDQNIKAWGGLAKGIIEMKGQEAVFSRYFFASIISGLRLWS